MSIPRLFGYHPLNYLRPARRMLDWDYFGLGISPEELSALMEFLQLSMSPRTEPELEQTTIGKDGFQVCIDVQQFKPSEISVKTVDNDVVVEGKHERPDGHSFISRNFIGKYALPKGYDPKTVVSSLSSDGVLTIKAPFPKEDIQSNNERVVQIQQTGPAYLNGKENPLVESKDKKKWKMFLVNC